MDMRPVRRRGEARRDDILRIARDVFLAEGYAAASMSAIAARVGGSKGTLYNHFPSKEALFTAFMEDACAAEAAHAFDFSESEGDLRKALLRAADRFLRFVLSDTAAAVHRVVIAEGGRFPELGRAFFEIGPKEAITRLTAFIDGEMAAGRLRDGDAMRAADQFLALCMAGLHQKRLWSVIGQPTEAEIEANVQSAVSVFLAAYGASQPG